MMRRSRTWSISNLPHFYFPRKAELVQRRLRSADIIFLFFGVVSQPATQVSLFGPWFDSNCFCHRADKAALRFLGFL
jgi:hypothetical protein